MNTLKKKKKKKKDKHHDKETHKSKRDLSCEPPGLLF